MRQEFTMKRSFPTDSESLFNYFTDARLLEQWAYPENMTLKIPQFEAHSGGRYRYEHQSDKGTFLCTGYIEELIPGKKIAQCDEFVKGPNGDVLYKNLECITEFNDQIDGAEVTITQKGFVDEKSLNECREGWNQCFDHLTKLIEVATGAGDRHGLSGGGESIQP